MGSISLSVALAMALLLEFALIPNPCLYHTPEYLAGKELPWWIRIFFPLNGGLHPEAGFLYYGIFGLVGTAGAAFITARRLLTKKTIRWQVERAEDKWK